MNKATKKILVGVGLVIVIGLISYIIFVGYVLYKFTRGCGMDDGPFYATHLTAFEISSTVQTFNLSDGKLILDNRNDSLSPILIFQKNDGTTWALDTDVSKTESYGHTRIWKISDLQIKEKDDGMDLKFIAYWTFGGEAGRMKINKVTGENSFCLSW